MCRVFKICLLFVVLIGCGEDMDGQIPVITKELELPLKENLWIFMMAGQSNMAGRATIEPKDKLTNNRILTINSKNEIIVAKEPLHFYEPSGAGLDCGISFGTEMLKSIPENVSILLIPMAVGGSSITQWINNDTHRGVNLLSNFTQRLKSSQNLGIIKGILWHQGEADAHSENAIQVYEDNMRTLFGKFRTIAGNISLPIVAGKLGSYAVNQTSWDKINESIVAYSLSDEFCEVIETSDLEDKGDRVHFNSNAQRILGKRYAEVMLKWVK
ncbi:sialate O-acetylesterase [Reichenbachiella sp. MALMAid0571]|uniref:sialate O-acetylesterase n=1 Tax=Reichenbachiella sp. MALMAid0571 TaxID=3143939 RepID=UPI0032DF9354